MLNLAFDTTAGACSVAVTQDDKVLERKIEKMEFGQAEVLFPIIQAMLHKNNLTPKNLDLITVCCGPGSFTGVRSSLAVARTLGLALPDVKITGVSAFEAYMEDLKDDELAEINAVIIETKREDFYFQSFDKKRNKISEPEALAYGDIVNLLRHKKITLIGNGVERFLFKPSGLSLHVIRMEEFSSIKALAKCGERKLKKNVLNYPKPLYLRAPDVCMP